MTHRVVFPLSRRHIWVSLTSRKQNNADVCDRTDLYVWLDTQGLTPAKLAQQLNAPPMQKMLEAKMVSVCACSVLQCVAVCCSVFQRVAVCRSTIDQPFYAEILMFSFSPFLLFSFVLNTHPPSLVFPVTHFPLCLCDYFFPFSFLSQRFAKKRKKPKTSGLRTNPKFAALGCKLCCSVLQRVAACCSVLQRVALCCRLAM